MNLIFLDFDGVLNSERSNLAYQTHERKIGWEPEGLDEIAVRLMRRLAEEADAKVVISSSWRHHFPDEQLQKFLIAKGWTSCEIIGHTPTFRYRDVYGTSPGFRGAEVASFLNDFISKKNELGTWVIIDDSVDFYYGETQIGGFHQNQPVVNTDERVGFSLQNFYDALKILKLNSQLLINLECKLLPTGKYK